MSDDIRTGRKARKIMMAMAAVMAVAVMIAVPLFAAVDTDADFTKDEQGYSVTYTNPTEEQMPAEMKAGLVMITLMEDMTIFNTDIFEDIAISNDPITIKIAEGQKIDSDTSTLITDYEISADKITITITATGNGSLINPDSEYMPSSYKDAAEAIKAVMGDEVTAGDVVKITGSLKFKRALQEETKYNLLDGDKCIISKQVSSLYLVNNYDLTVSFKHGAGEEVSVKLISNLKGMYGDEKNREYETTPIQVGTKYTIKDKVSTLNVAGNTHYTVKDKDYAVDYSPLPDLDKHRVVAEGDLEDLSSINTNDIKSEMETLPAPADNVTVDKSYSSAQSAFDGVVMDAIGDDLLKIVLIVVGVVIGVIVLVVILIIVLIVLKKKKKNQ